MWCPYMSRIESLNCIYGGGIEGEVRTSNQGDMSCPLVLEKITTDTTMWCPYQRVEVLGLPTLRRDQVGDVGTDHYHHVG